MQLEHIEQQLDKRRALIGLQATLRSGATEDDISATEERVGHRLPDQVRAFYSQWNGLTVADPPFEIVPINALIRDGTRILFAIADNVHRIGFNCSQRNEAKQWDIIDMKSGQRITFTIASFWSNKMWKWIDRRLAFWRGEV